MFVGKGCPRTCYLEVHQGGRFKGFVDLPPFRLADFWFEFLGASTTRFVVSCTRDSQDLVLVDLEAMTRTVLTQIPTARGTGLEAMAVSPSGATVFLKAGCHCWVVLLGPLDPVDPVDPKALSTIQLWSVYTVACFCGPDLVGVTSKGAVFTIGTETLGETAVPEFRLLVPSTPPTPLPVAVDDSENDDSSDESEVDGAVDIRGNIFARLALRTPAQLAAIGKSLDRAVTMDHVSVCVQSVAGVPGPGNGFVALACVYVQPDRHLSPDYPRVHRTDWVVLHAEEGPDGWTSTLLLDTFVLGHDLGKPSGIRFDEAVVLCGDSNAGWSRPPPPGFSTMYVGFYANMPWMLRTPAFNMRARLSPPRLAWMAVVARAQLSCLRPAPTVCSIHA